MSEGVREIVYLPNSSSCFICGEENHAGLQARFFVEGNQVKAKLNPQEHHCGYENVVHGGIAAALLDECMGWAAARAIHRMCVTAELTLRYIENLPPNVETIVVTEVEKSNRRLVSTKGVIVDGAGKEYVRAVGKFTPLTVEQTLAVDDQLLYRGDEERLFDALRAG